ncbi:MAG: hypothetical protein WCS20_07325 [Alphaproteobacteria bacterium]
MIFPSNKVRVLVATNPTDFRKSHDGLAALVAAFGEWLQTQRRKISAKSRLGEKLAYILTTGMDCKPS